MTEQRLDRPKLSRGILSDHGILYHEEVYDHMSAESKLPVHVNNVREALLCFSGIRIPDGPQGWRPTFLEEARNLQEAHESRGTFTSDLSLEPPLSTYFDVEKHLRRQQGDWEDQSYHILR